MSLYVNAALRRTRAGYVHLGCGEVSVRKSLSLLNSHNYSRPRRQQRTSPQTVPQLPERSCSQPNRPSLRVISLHAKPHTNRIHLHAAPLETSITNGTTVYTQGNVQYVDPEDVEPYVRFTSLTNVAAPSQAASQFESSADRHVLRGSKLHSHEHEQVASVAKNTPSSTLDHQDSKEIDEAYLPFSGQRPEECQSWVHTFRQIPLEFGVYLARLRGLIAEKRGNDYIRDVFSDMIRAKEHTLQAHGHALETWLNGPWDYDRATEIMHSVLGSIVTSPYQAVTILRHLDVVESDFWFRSRCLSMIGRLHKDLICEDATLQAMFEEEVSKLRLSSRWPPRGMSCQDLSLMLWLLDDSEAEQLIQSFLKVYPAPARRVHVWLAMYCARHKMDSLALSLLTSLPPHELQAPSTLVLQCCHVLLGHDVVESTAEGSNFKLLPRLLEHGLTPDSMLYSQIIERAFESGYPGVAWDVFRHLQANKVSITGRTYFLLLRHSFKENNATGVQEIMSEIQRKDGFRTNLPLLHYSMNIVRRIFYYERAMTTAESLSHILALYDRVFSREPLSKLGILPPRDFTRVKAGSSKTETAKLVCEPDAYSLSFTVWAHVLCHRSGKHAQTLWKRVQELVNAGDTAIVECMRHDLIYNAFIWLNLRDSTSMADALEILQYMLAKQLCMPTDRTWSILICGFLRQDQRAQAQHIFQLMKQCNLGVSDIRREYWRRNWTFEYFEKHLEKILDEGMMPDGTETGAIDAAKSSKPSVKHDFIAMDLEEEEEYVGDLR